jgi:curved DNA-binding protein CbpA
VLDCISKSTVVSLPGRVQTEKKMSSNNHYSILGIQSKATESEIRSAFKKLARKYHPDKRMYELEKLSNPQTYDSQSDALAGTGASTFDEMFSLLANAYSVLSDPVKRAAYDIELMGNSKKTTGSRSFTESLQKLRALRKQDAELQSHLMEVAFVQRREAELKRNGVIFLEAWYGATDTLEAPEKHPNEVVDVTKQLQTLVEESRMVLPKGESKAISIPGVFDPCPENSNKSLKLKYSFKGKLHMVTVGDDEMLIVPVKAHLVSTITADGNLRNSLQAVEELGREAKIILGPGAGKLVQSSRSKMKIRSKAEPTSSPFLKMMIFGATISVIGSITITLMKTKIR